MYFDLLTLVGVAIALCSSLGLSLVLLKMYLKSQKSLRVAQLNLNQLEELKRRSSRLQKEVWDLKNPPNQMNPKNQKYSRLKGELKDWEWGI